MSRYASLVLALFLSSVALSEACRSKCRFRFCDGSSSFKVGRNDVALTGPICLKSRVRVGIVNTGEARILHPRTLPISHWYPKGLKQRFSPSFFKAYNVRVYFHGRWVLRSGVGHEKPQQNQALFLNKKCWALPITAYQVLDNRGYVIDNKHPRNPLVDCIAFRTFTH